MTEETRYDPLGRVIQPRPRPIRYPAELRVSVSQQMRDFVFNVAKEHKTSVSHIIRTALHYTLGHHPEYKEDRDDLSDLFRDATTD